MAAPNFVVSTIFKAKDRISAQFKKMGKASDNFGNKAQRNFNKASKAANGFGKITKGILAAGAIQRGIGILTAGIGEAANEFVRFDDVLTAAAVRFKDIGPDAKNFKEQLDIIKKSAREAGATTTFTASQAGEALDFMARAGFRSEVAMKSLRSMISLSIATGEDFATVANQSTDLLGAFGLASDNTAQKIKNLNRLNDVLVKTTNSANVTVEDMFETMKTVGPIATGILGASLEEVAALTAVLGNSGIKGSNAMTALKNSYLRLASPTSESRKTLEELGITLDDGHGNAKRLTDVMEELGGKLKKMGNIRQAKILDQLFGKFAIAGGKNLINNIANIKEFEKSLLNAGGAAQKTADIMSKSLGNQLKTLKSALFELTFKVFAEFRDQGVGGIEDLTEAIRAIDPKPLVDGIKEIIKVIKVLNDTIQPVVTAFKFLSRMEDAIPGFKQLEGVINPFQAVANAFAPSAPENAKDLPVVQALAPNQREAGAKAQANQFSGTINFNHPPPGTTYTQGPGPVIQTSGLGAQ